MNKNIKSLSRFKKKSLSLSIAVILASSLTACGGSDSDSDPVVVNKPDVTQPELPSGLLCIDSNNNGKCDEGEVRQEGFSGTEIPESMKSNDYARLLEITDGSLYVTSPGSDEINVYSTMIANEILFNPTISADKAKAATYLNEQLSLATDGSVTTEQAEQIKGSIKTALETHSTAHPLKVIAAVVSKFIETKEFNITVDTNEVNAQHIAKRNITLQGEELTWEQSHGDETPDFIIPLAGRNMTAMTMHYHNRIMVIDTSGETPIIKSNGLFASVEGDRHLIDATTGASEHRLRGAKASPDGEYVYINFRPSDGDDSIGTSDNYGLFRVTINDDGSFAEHDDPTTKRFVNAYIGNFEIVGDKVHVEDLDEEVTYILNLDLTDTGEFVTVKDLVTTSLATLANVKEQFTSPDGMYLYAATEGDNDAANQLHKINTTTGVIDGVATLDKIFGTLKFFNEGQQALVYDGDYAAIIDLENMTLSQTLPLASSVRSGEITPDNNYAIFSSESDAVWVFDLNAIDVNVVASLDVGERIRAFAADDKGNIFIAGRGFNHVKKLNIGNVLTPEQVLAADKAAVVESDINGGSPLSVVISDLSLATTIPAGSGSTIAWSSNVSNVNTLKPTNDDDPILGAVTRPVNGSGDLSGVLTADLNFSFRDISLDDVKNFDFSVRQMPEILPIATSIQTANNSAQYPAANVDGDIMLAPVRFENANEDNVYGFIGLNLVDGAPVIVSGTADTPKTYLDTESLVGVGIHGSYGIGISSAVEVGNDAGQARIFTVKMNATGVLSDAVTTSIDINTGVPQKVGFNADQSIASVMIKKDDDSYISEFYAIGDAGEVSLTHTINLEPAAYKTYGPPAINSDGSRVYQRDEDNVIMTTADGSTTSAAVNEIARVWSHDSRVFALTYEGNIVSFNEALEESSRKMFYTGTGGRMYSAAGRAFNGKDYLYIAVQRADSALNGIYQLEIMDDGSLKEVAFSNTPEGDGADRMTVSGDGDTVYFSYRIRSGDNKGRHFGVIEMPNQ
ncbi:MAG: hypothetical protein GY787_32380 [Alteromonadales bacterium]|nr:hypothetical protein [Alteromonadales bacterium]